MKAHKTKHSLWESRKVYGSYDMRYFLELLRVEGYRFHLIEQHFNNTIAAGCSKEACKITPDTKTSDIYMIGETK